MASVVQPQVDCSTAEELIHALSPLGPHFKNCGPKDQWLFRGQGRDDPLIPTLFRSTGRFAQLRSVGNYEQTLIAERDLLVRFFEIADKRGLLLPDDSQSMRATLATLQSHRGTELLRSKFALAEGWEPASLALSLAALAQHYGVPTRLLDWTRKPYFAAYFAAESAWRSIQNREREKKILQENCTDGNQVKAIDGSSLLVVWAFYFPELGRRHEVYQDSDPIRVITAPSATNPNLSAQQGVFTWLNWRRTGEANGKYLPMDQVLERLANQARPDADDVDKLIIGCKIRRFTLPTSEVDALLYLLAKVDVTPSAVYPGYSSILSDLEMEVRWWHPATVSSGR